MDHGRPTRRALLATGLALATAGCTDGGAQSPPTPGGGPSSGPSSGPSTPPTTPGWSDLQVSGGLARPGQAGYDPSTLLYNPRFSPAPQAIARCRTADDVAACVRYAGRTGTGLRLRAGGHSYGGWSAGDGLVADLTGMDAVELADDGRSARIGAGARLVDVYTALGARGVAIGAGSCPTVGFSGLTLGGGVGVLARSFGLTCDQVRSIDVVTADGTSRTVDAGNDPDLFWALRGGGGGIAAVTSWTVAVRPAPEVTVFFLRWDLSQGADVLGAWQRWSAQAPRELWSTCKLLVNPADGDRVQVSGAWTGSAALDLSGLLAGLPKPAATSRRALGYTDAMLYEAGCSGLDAQACTARALDAQHRQPFAATSSMLGAQLPQAGLDAALAAVRTISAPEGTVEAGMSFDALGGAVTDVAPDATAFPWRTALATVQHTATWTGTRTPEPFDAVVAGTRRALEPWTGTAAYVNYADAGLPDRAAACWGENRARLRQVAAAVDPDRVFAFPGSVTA
ncbi:FAD-binding oxidoreductase [Kineococcus rhizosphaerae]|uniref:FAD/FMN-containing dehydrogenase n=1 Tax=Kineococcus rhizosphaerae TaxID=559628 RepID=A0A2T0R6S8_9ACTN|nr:FAD-binding oxidoreductase [Kineococcus rhizosphaerae]PRY16853.1 FAD/FMN-containing dehydrogenase [Kineococcus rhizosphaerae]